MANVEAQTAPAARPASGLDGRWIAAAVILGLTLVLAGMIGWLGKTKALRLAGALPLNVHFADLYVFPSARLEIEQGGDPYVQNPTDPFRRVFNYPRLWLSFMRFPVTWIPVIGTGLIAAVLAGVFFWWGRLTWWQGLIGGTLICSPPLVLAFERGNSDLIIWLLVLASLGALQRGWLTGSWLGLAGAFVLKLYPAAAFAMFLRMGWRRAWPWLVVAGCLVTGYVYLRQDELRAIARNTPSGIEVSYGAIIWTKAAGRLVGMLGGERVDFVGYARPSMAAALAVGVGAFLAGYFGRAKTAGPEPDRFLDGFRIGASIYTITFIVGASYVYRHVFLLLAVPWLWQAMSAGPGGLPRARLVALVLLGGMFLINPFWWFPLIVAREICAWGLFGILGWLLGATCLRPAVTTSVPTTGHRGANSENGKLNGTKDDVLLIRHGPTKPAFWSAHRSRMASIAVVVGCAVLAYHNTLSVPFLFDDDAAITSNPTIRNLSALGEVLSPPNSATGAGGRPLVNLSLAVNFALSGLDPLGYHLTNLLLHALSGVLLLGLVYSSLRLPALRERYGPNALLLATGAAVWWTVHPLQTESVTCVVQRSEVLGGFFYLLTLFLFVRGIDSPAARRWQILAVLAAALGTVAKEIIFSAPLVALVLDRLFVAGSFREAWRLRRWTYLGFLGTWLMLAVVIASHGKRGGTVGFGLGVSSWDYLLTQSKAIVLYLKLSLWPHPLVLDYGDALVTGLSAVWLHAVFVTALVVATGVLLWRGSKWALPGVWFFCILAPSSSLVPLTTQTIAEHRMYLPLVAMIVPAVLGLHSVLRRRELVVVALILPAVVLTAMTWRRNQQYQSTTGIWTLTVGQVPGNYRAWNNLTASLLKELRVGEALASAREALRLKPDSAASHNNLGFALFLEGQMEAAIASCKEALRLDPEMTAPHYTLGLVFLRTGRIDEAIAEFGAVLQRIPHNAEAWVNLGEAWYQKGDLARAEGAWRTALAHESGVAEAYYNLGNLRLRAGHLGEAAGLFENALRAKPDYSEAHGALGMALQQLGRSAEARDHLEKARRVATNSYEAHYNLGHSYYSAGRLLEAIEEYRKAISLKPSASEAHYNLGNALFRLNRVAEAITSFRESLRHAPDFADAHYNLAQAYVLAGKPREAIPHAQALIRLEPESPSARELLAHILQLAPTNDFPR